MSYPKRPSPTFETTDLNLASFLRCREFRITEISSPNGRTVFAFDDSFSLHSAILDYANDGAVPVRSFCSTLRDLKALTHTAHQETGRRVSGMDRT